MLIDFRTKLRETFFLNHFGILVLAALSLIVFSYFFIDIPLAEYFRNPSATIYFFARVLTELIDPAYHYILWPLAFCLLRFYYKKPKLAHQAMVIMLSIPLSNLVIGLIKRLSGRARPELLFEQHIYGFTFFATAQAYLSFPSGHACTAGAICGALSAFYPSWLSLICTIGMILSLSRVVLLAHYFGDVIAGFVIGLCIAQWIFGKMKQKSLFLNT